MNRQRAHLALLGATLFFVAQMLPAGAGAAKSAEHMRATRPVRTKPSDSKSDFVNKAFHLGDFSISEHVSGPGVDLAKATNKLTVLYFWGYRCAPCMATLPKLARLDHEYRSKGLLVVGIHAATGDVKDIRATCEKRGVEFSVYRQYKVPSNYRVKALPQVLMFDAAGNVVFDGHYSEISKQIEDRFKD